MEVLLPNTCILSKLYLLIDSTACFSHLLKPLRHSEVPGKGTTTTGANEGASLLALAETTVCYRVMFLHSLQPLYVLGSQPTARQSKYACMPCCLKHRCWCRDFWDQWFCAGTVLPSTAGMAPVLAPETTLRASFFECHLAFI